MTTEQTNLMLAEKELRDAQMMPDMTHQEQIHRLVMIKAKAENLAHVACVNRAHLEASPCGCAK